TAASWPRTTHLGACATAAPPHQRRTTMAELDLDAIERHARAAEGHTQWVADVLMLVAEVRRLRAALTDRQTLAAVYGYELGLADAAGTDTNPPTSGE